MTDQQFIPGMIEHRLELVAGHGEVEPLARRRRCLRLHYALMQRLPKHFLLPTAIPLLLLLGPNSIENTSATYLDSLTDVDLFLPAAKPAGQWMTIGIFLL